MPHIFKEERGKGLVQQVDPLSSPRMRGMHAASLRVLAHAQDGERGSAC